MGGIAVPSLWHALAILVALLCHRSGTTVPMLWKGLTLYVVTIQQLRLLRRIGGTLLVTPVTTVTFASEHITAFRLLLDRFFLLGYGGFHLLGLIHMATGYGDFLADQFLDIFQQRYLLGVAERERHTFTARTTRTPDPMYISLGYVRKLIVNDV